jgi:recombination protein RecA
VKTSIKSTNRARQVAATLSSEFGSAWVLDSKTPPVPEVLRSGIACLDAAIGVGGLPRGRFIIVHGPESSGKTTLCLEFVIAVQQANGIAIYFDFERKLNLPYAAAMGVDLTTMVLSKPKSIENGFAIMERAIDRARSLDAKCPILFVWDSLHASAAKATMDSGYEDPRFPREAQAYAQSFQKFMPQLEESGSLFVGISQVRKKVDRFGSANGDKIAIGQAANFYASVILQMRPKHVPGQVKGKGGGEEADVILKKNQVAAPWTKCTVPVIYGLGVNKPLALLYAAEMVGIGKKLPATKERKGWWRIQASEDPKARAIEVEGVQGMIDLERSKPEAFAGIVEAVYARIGRAELARITPMSDEALDAEDPIGGPEGPAEETEVDPLEE